MIVGMKSNTGLGLIPKLVEAPFNDDASNYVLNKYIDLIKVIKSLGIKEEKAFDLLHDVYISLTEAERNGEGYDINYGDGNITLVEQFVIGRIKLYAKNPKYRTDIVESGKMSVTKTEIIKTEKVDKSGVVKDKLGNVMYEKRYVRTKDTITASVSAASYNEGKDVTDNNDSFQKAYAMASGDDSIEDLIEMCSLKEQIDYCIDVCSLHEVNILNVLKNIDKLADMLCTRGKKRADEVFSKITQLVEYNSDLGEALTEVLQYSQRNKARFADIISEY